MASLGALVVSLSANTAQFTSAMDKAAHMSTKRMEQMQKSAKVAGAAIGAAFVAGAGAAAVLVKQAIDSADAMTKMAQKAGTSVETFSTMAYAAKLSGVEVGSLQTSMSKLGMVISDVARGANKDASAAFDALGISATDSSGKLKNSEAIMKEVAARFVNMEDGAGKTALAMKIFGRNGADLIPMLNQGEEGLTAMQEEARALGVEIDGVSGGAAERFNDNLTRLNTLKKGFANQIMKAVLPSLEGMTNRLIDSAKASGGLEKAARIAANGLKILLTGGTLIAATFKAVGEYLGGVAAQAVAFFSGDFKGAMAIGAEVNADFLATLKGAAGTVSTIWDEAANEVESKAGATSTKLAAPIIAAAEKATKGREKIAVEANKVQEEIERVIDGLALQADLMGKSEKESTLWKLSLAGANEEQKAFTGTILDFIDAKQKEMDVMTEGARIAEEMRTPYEQFSDRIVRLNDLLQAGAINWDVYSRAVVAAQDNFDSMSKKGEDAMANLQKSVEGWGKQYTDTFVDGVMKGKLSFKELANSIIADILRIIIQKQVLNALGDFGGKGSAGSGILGAIGSAFGGARASGGSVNAGTSYLVGEKGPELFTAGASGNITPNNQLAGKTINVSVTQYNSFETGYDKAMMAKQLQQLKAQTKAEVVEQLSRAM